MFAIVIPIYKPLFDLNKFEKLSIKNNCNIFSDSPVVFILPKKLIGGTKSFEEFVGRKLDFLFFDNSYFVNIRSYNNLLTSTMFYKNFIKYSHIFICQTDVWVFENRIWDYINLNFSFIGGVHYKGSSNKSLWNIENISGAINGGASLRSVKDHIRVLNINKQWFNIWLFFKFFIRRIRYYKFNFQLYKNEPIFQTVGKEVKDLNEDLFFYEVSKILYWFSMPCALNKQLLMFSWDAAPNVLYNKTKELPMACHAWYREDSIYKGNYQFWKKHINISEDEG